MEQATAEVLILTLNALGAGLLMFVGRVLQPMLDAMGPADFRGFLVRLVGGAMTEPFAVTISTLPLLAGGAYFAVYGFGRWWFTAGFVVWIIGSAATKVLNMPVYRWAADPRSADAEQVGRMRRQLRIGNNVRAWLTLASVALMACQFNAAAVAAGVAASAALSLPLCWIGRRYAPG